MTRHHQCIIFVQGRSKPGIRVCSALLMTWLLTIYNPVMQKPILAFFLGLSLLFSISLSAQDLCSGLLLYYPCAGNAGDSSGNGFNGLVHNAVISDGHAGLPGSAYHFNGQSSRIEWPNVAMLKPQLPVSFSFWIRADNISGLKGIVSTDFTEDFYSGFWASILPDSTVAFAYGSGGTTSICCRRAATSTTKLLPGQWYFIAGVLRGPLSMDIYINGVAETVSYSGDGGALLYYDNPGNIARVDVRNNDPYCLQGSIDHFAFWGKALTQANVTDLFIHGIPARPTAGFDFAVNGMNVAFTDKSVNATSWSWSFGDGSVSAQQNPDHHYALAGSYKVFLTAHNSCGEATTWKQVVISCVPPRAGFTWEYLAPEVHFNDTTVSASFISRLWDFGDGTTSTQKEPVHTFASGQIAFRVCLTVNDSCGTTTTCDTVYCAEPLDTRFSAVNVASHDRLIRFQDETPGAVSWKWTFGDGGSSRERNPVHLYAGYGDFKVCLLAGYPPVHTYCSLLKIIPLSQDIPAIILYPNPTEGISFIRVKSDAGKATLKIYDLPGATLFSTEIGELKADLPVRIDLSRYPKGIYFIRCTTGELDKVWKIVLQ